MSIVLGEAALHPNFRLFSEVFNDLFVGHRLVLSCSVVVTIKPVSCMTSNILVHTYEYNKPERKEDGEENKEPERGRVRHRNLLVS